MGSSPKDGIRTNMPNYIFSNPSDPLEFIEVFFHMNDEKVFIKDGVKWNREWTIPEASFDIKCDPFNSKQFVQKTSKGGKLGELYSRSEELSQRRAAKNGGVDTVKENFYSKWSKDRRGRVHPDKLKQSRPETYLI